LPKLPKFKQQSKQIFDMNLLNITKPNIPKQYLDESF